jgi:hypothetical protein
LVDERIKILFLFAQTPTVQAQETLDLSKVTYDQFVGEKLATPSNYIVIWLSGYYHGKHMGNTIVEPQTLKQNEEKIYSYCSHHTDTTSWMPSITCWRARTSEKTLSIDLMAQRRFASLLRRCGTPALAAIRRVPAFLNPRPSFTTKAVLDGSRWREASARHCVCLCYPPQSL